MASRPESISEFTTLIVQPVLNGVDIWFVDSCHRVNEASEQGASVANGRLPPRDRIMSQIALGSPHGELSR